MSAIKIIQKNEGELFVTSDNIKVRGELQNITFGTYSQKFKCSVIPYSSISCAEIINIFYKYNGEVKLLTNPPELKLEIARFGKPAIICNPLKFPCVPVKKVQEYKESLRELAEQLLDSTQDMYCKPSSRLMSHQRTAFIKLNDMRGAVLDMGMATGKTFTALVMAFSKKHDFGVVFAPKDIIETESVWPNNFERHFTANAVFISKGRLSIDKFVAKAKETEAMCKRKSVPLILMVNYESMYQGSLEEYLLKSNFDFTIYDEVHRLKGNGPISKFAAKLTANSKRIIGGSGTILPHSPVDAFGTFRAIDPAAFGKSITVFRNTFVVTVKANKKTGRVINGEEQTRPISICTGFQNEDIMRDTIRAISHRVSSEEIDLPEPVSVFKYFDLSQAEQSIYDVMESKLCAEIEAGTLVAANAMVKVLKLQQIVGGTVKDQEGTVQHIGDSKVNHMIKVLEDVDQDEPIVVMCRFNAEIELVKKRLLESGRSVSVLTRSVNEVASWKNGETSALVCQIQKAKEGIELTRSSLTIYYSIGYRVSDLDQSMFRTRRPEQKKINCRYIFMVSRTSAEQGIYDRIDGNRDLINRVLEGISNRRKK